MSDTSVWDVLRAVLSNWWFWLIVLLVLVGTGTLDVSPMTRLVDKAVEVIRAAK